MTTIKNILFITVILLVSQNTFAAKNRCTVQLNDINVRITGLGDTPIEAFKNAALKCYDARETAFKSIRKRFPAEDQALAMIDDCGNLTCEKTN